MMCKLSELHVLKSDSQNWCQHFKYVNCKLDVLTDHYESPWLIINNQGMFRKRVLQCTSVSTSTCQ